MKTKVKRILILCLVFILVFPFEILASMTDGMNTGWVTPSETESRSNDYSIVCHAQEVYYIAPIGLYKNGSKLGSVWKNTAGKQREVNIVAKSTGKLYTVGFSVGSYIKATETFLYKNTELQGEYQHYGEYTNSPFSDTKTSNELSDFYALYAKYVYSTKPYTDAKIPTDTKPINMVDFTAGNIFYALSCVSQSGSNDDATVYYNVDPEKLKEAVNRLKLKVKTISDDYGSNDDAVLSILKDMAQRNILTKEGRQRVVDKIGKKGSYEYVSRYWRNDSELSSADWLSWIAGEAGVLAGSTANDANNDQKNQAGNTVNGTTSPNQKDPADTITGVSEDIWHDWYIAAYKIASGIRPEDAEWKLADGYDKAERLLAYDIPDEKRAEYWRRVYDVLCVAYSKGTDTGGLGAWDPSRASLTEAYKEVVGKANGQHVAPNGVQNYQASLNNLNMLESSTPGTEMKRMLTFYDRITSLYHVSTLNADITSPDYSWISSYYGADIQVSGHYIPPSLFPETTAIQSLLTFSGSQYQGYPALGGYSADNDLVLPYMLSTIWELPYLCDYMAEEMNDAITNSTILEHQAMYQSLVKIKQAVDEMGMYALTAMWNWETDKPVTYKSLSAMYEACKKDPKVIAQEIAEEPVTLTPGKPLNDFIDYTTEPNKLSKYYTMGIAYSATLVPMKSNVYSDEWIKYLDTEFFDNFYTQWGFNRKALYIDKTSGAGEAYFTSGKTSKGELKVCTLRDLLKTKDDVVLYLDNNFYNADKLQQSSTAKPTYNVTNEEGKSQQLWWNSLAADIEDTYNTNFENIVKTGANTNYSKTFYEMMSKVSDAHVYYPEASSTNPGNQDNIVLNSGKINYYLKSSEVGSEIYSPLQAYALISAIYRDGSLFTRANSKYVQRPVFIASKTAPHVNGASIEEQQTIFNYALLKNLEASMPIAYTGNLDMDCPLYMDIFGNILAESGTVIVPATSNATIMNHTNYNKALWSAGLFSIYGKDYSIPTKRTEGTGLADIVSNFFQPDEKGKVYIPKPITIGDDYKIDLSRLATTSKDTLDTLYTIMLSELQTSAENGDPLYDADSYFQICLEVLRGAPIENIDKDKEGLNTSSRINRAGIVAAAKLEDLNNSLDTNGENTTLSMPNLAFMPGFNYIALMTFKVLLLVVVIINMLTVLLDAVSESLNLGTFWKCFMAFVLTMLTVLTVPAVFEVTYYESNRALLQNETSYISMLNLEKSESGVEIGVTEVTEPNIRTKLYLKLEDVQIPWYELFYNSFYTNTYKTLDSMYANYAQEHTAVANRDDVEIKNDGVYVDINDVYASTSIDLDMREPDGNVRRLIQTASTKTSTFSFYSPYYAILDALVQNVNYYNAHPWEDVDDADGTQGWYTYTTKNQKGGKLKTMGIIEPYFTSSRFMEEDGKDVLGLKAVYGDIYSDGFSPDPATYNFFTADNLKAMKSSYWYPEGMSQIELDKRMQLLTKEARTFVAKNKDMIGKISDETFLKVMAMNLAVKHNRIFGGDRSSAFEIYNLSNDDLIRLSIAKREDVMVNSTLSYPRFVYAVGGTSSVFAAALLSMVMWISGIVKPILVVVAFLTIFISIFVFKVCARKKTISLYGYFITVLLLCGTNILYSIILKLSMYLPTLGLTPFMCIIVQIIVQVAYLMILFSVVATAFKDWHDLGYTRYALKIKDAEDRWFHFLHRDKTNSSNPFYGGTTMQSDPEKNWNYYDNMLEERRKRYK